MSWLVDRFFDVLVMAGIVAIIAIIMLAIGGAP